MTINVNFRIGHKLLKFIIGYNLTKKPVVDTTAFQKFHGFISQMQFR